MVLNRCPRLLGRISQWVFCIDFKQKKRKSNSLYLHYQSHLPPCPRSTQNLTYEIILTLGQAFEVAYQLALQAQRTKQHQNPPAGLSSDMVETRSSKPVPRPRGSVRKSAVSLAASSAEPRERRLFKHRLHLNTDFYKTVDGVVRVEEQ